MKRWAATCLCEKKKTIIKMQSLADGETRFFKVNNDELSALREVDGSIHLIKEGPQADKINFDDDDDDETQYDLEDYGTIWEDTETGITTLGSTLLTELNGEEKNNAASNMVGYGSHVSHNKSSDIDIGPTNISNNNVMRFSGGAIHIVPKKTTPKPAQQNQVSSAFTTPPMAKVTESVALPTTPEQQQEEVATTPPICVSNHRNTIFTDSVKNVEKSAFDTQFDDYLEQINKVHKETGDLDLKYCLSHLCKFLSDIKIQQISNADKITRVKSYIDVVKVELEDEPGLWGLIKPLLNGILQLLNQTDLYTSPATKEWKARNLDDFPKKDDGGGSPSNTL